MHAHCTYVPSYSRACIQSFTHACICMDVCMSAHACMHACMHACIFVSIHRHTLACMHVCMPGHMHAYIRTDKSSIGDFGHTTCMKSLFGDFGHHSRCYGRRVVQCICALLNTHHMRHKLAWNIRTPCMVLRSWGRPTCYSTPTTCIRSSFGEFGHNSRCCGRGVVQCICELFHTHHMNHKLVWRFWTPSMVLRSWGRPMYM